MNCKTHLKTINNKTHFCSITLKKEIFLQFKDILKLLQFAIKILENISWKGPGIGTFVGYVYSTV